MRHFLKNLNKISIKILLSYLSILILPFCAIVGIYNFSIQTILSMQKEKSLYTLVQASKIIDMRLEELQQISSYISNDTMTVSVANRSAQIPGQSPALALYQLLHHLPNYSLSNQMVQDIFIFFNEVGYTVNQASAFETTDYNYYAHINFSSISFEHLQELQHTSFSQGSFLLTQQGDKREMFMLRSIPDIGAPQGLIVIQIREEAIQDLLQSSRFDSETNVYIIDSAGNIITYLDDVPQNDLDFDIPYLSQSKETKFNGKNYILSTTASQSDWLYISFTTKEHVLKEISLLHYPILLLGLASILIGLAICIVLWHRRDRFYKKVVSLAKSSGVAPKARNEQCFLDEAITSFMDIMVDMRTNMEQQKDLMFDSMLHGLLDGNFDVISQLNTSSSAETYGLSAKFYCVVYVSMGSNPDANKEDTLSYRIHIKQLLQNTLPVSYEICDLDENGFAALLMANSQNDLTQLPLVLSEITGYLKSSSQYTTTFALSKICCKLDDIPIIFRQSKDTFEYMHLREETGYRCYDSIAELQDLFFFPADTETRLIQLLRKGNTDELAAHLNSLLVENIENRKLSLSMLKELLGLLRQCILQTLPETSISSEKISEIVTCIEATTSIPSLFSCIMNIQQQIQSASQDKSDSEETRLKKHLMKLICQNYGDPCFSLYTLSVETKISEATLYRRFKLLFDTTFSEYLEQYRIKQACLLLQQKVPVNKVANLTGYSSDHAFRRAFKRITNILPSRYHPA